MQEKVFDLWKIGKIVNSKTSAELRNSTMEVSGEATEAGITRDLLPIDVNGLREVRFTKVSAGTSVSPHFHEGPIFRFITKGSATVNGEVYNTGDWMAIPPGLEYSISTDSGYEALWICVKCQNQLK